MVLMGKALTRQTIDPFVILLVYVYTPDFNNDGQVRIYSIRESRKNMDT